MHLFKGNVPAFADTTITEGCIYQHNWKSLLTVYHDITLLWKMAVYWMTAVLQTPAQLCYFVIYFHFIFKMNPLSFLTTNNNFWTSNRQLITSILAFGVRGNWEGEEFASSSTTTAVLSRTWWKCRPVVHLYWNSWWLYSDPPEGVFSC